MPGVQAVEAASIGAGEHVLVLGAAGGVGHFAVQFASYFGAHVIATASGAKASWLRSLGAAEVIDYETTRFEDVVHDAFLGLYRKWPKLHDQDRALGYLRTSVLNGCRTAHRGRTRRAWGGWLIPLAAAVAVIVVAATPVCTISTLFRLPSARGTRVLFAGFRLRGGLQ